ncbi:MAG: YciI family protein [Candidatus Binatia bacterium]
MRFMILLKADKDTEAGVMPSTELLTAMGQYNDALLKAGVLIDGAGLQSSAKGARVALSGKTRTVTEGPFAEAKELIAGYWMFQVQSKEEAIEWVKRCPNPHDDGEAEIEIRQVFEIEDFANAPEAVQELELALAQRRKSTKSVK